MNSNNDYIALYNTISLSITCVSNTYSKSTKNDFCCTFEQEFNQIFIHPHEILIWKCHYDGVFSTLWTVEENVSKVLGLISS